MELTNEEKKTVRVNPFMVPYNTPHDTAPFDRITLADYEEAFMEGIRRDNELIEKTINSTEKPTFDNTILNKDEDSDGYYDLLSRVSAVIASENGNVIKLEHNQFVSINRNAAVELRITLEAFGTEHKNQILSRLEKEGYQPKIVRTSV